MPNLLLCAVLVPVVHVSGFSSTVSPVLNRAFQQDSTTTRRHDRVAPLFAESRREFISNSVATTATTTTAVVLSTGLVTTSTTAAVAANPAAPGLVLPPMGLGAWAWGDSLFWGCKYAAPLLQLSVIFLRFACKVGRCDSRHVDFI